MSELKDNYIKIIKEVETRFHDESDVNFIKEKINEVTTLFMDIIDRLTYITNSRISEFEEKQNELEDRIEDVHQTVTGIENDIYEDEEIYEFEIICPYCNYEFVADINSENSTEIECPECKNIIELDWDGEEERQEPCICGENCECSNCSCESEYNHLEENTEIIEESPETENISQNDEQEKDEDM